MCSSFKHWFQLAEGRRELSKQADVLLPFAQKLTL